MIDQTKKIESSAPLAKTLADRVIIVTGASRGIGRAIALRLARDGAKVVLAARDAAKLAEVVKQIELDGGAAVSLPIDLRTPEAPAAVADTAIRAYGAIHSVVNNAGATRRGDFFELSEADWSDGFNLKFFCMVRLSRAAWPHLKKSRGSVLNIIGIGARTPEAVFTIGGSVNGACLSFTKALSDIGIRDGVQVNAINPGWIRTDRLRSLLAAEAAKHGGDLERAAEEACRRANIVRVGEPEDIANLAAFVLSPQSSYLHGAFIDIDGGLTKTI